MNERIEKLQTALKEKGLDAAVIEDPVDLYYLTGLKLSAGQLWVGKEESLLLVDGRYIAKAGKRAKLLSKAEAEAFLQRVQAVKIGFDGKKMSFERAADLQKFSGEWISWGGMTESLRAVKSLEEIACLQESANLLWEGYLHIQSLLKEGITEQEVSLAFTLFCLSKGAERLSFDPIIAFGENSALPHYRPGEVERKLKKGDVVLIDIGVVFKSYASDMTRVLFFGEPDPKIQKWLELTIAANKAAFALVKPGVKVGDLDKAARAVFKEAGVEEYFVHNLGHGIGLEVHEFPRIRFDSETILEEGMVFTIEPGLYLPGLGGVRYEDMVLVEEKGALNFF
jgi:Xaa-Pro aminopeptidase